MAVSTKQGHKPHIAHRPEGSFRITFYHPNRLWYPDPIVLDVPDAPPGYRAESFSLAWNGSKLRVTVHTRRIADAS